MSQRLLRKAIKPFVPKPLIRKFRYRLSIRNSLKPIAQRVCPLCGYEGWFGRIGRPPRLDARCPKCGSLERHRLLYLALQRNRIDLDIDTRVDKVLHFAAEAQLARLFRKKYTHYQTADLFAKADLSLNIEDIDLPDNSYKLVIANHVLEHVDDIKAANEIKRILKVNGAFIAMVPIIEGWEKTYENESIKTANERWLHFGRGDHVRFYGRDFRARIEKSGLVLTKEITAEGEDVLRYGLTRGEKVFEFRKPD